MKPAIFFPFLLLISCQLIGQSDISLYGLVVEQNSRYRTGQIRYLSGVNVRSGSASTMSDIKGKFSLIFSDEGIGQTVRIIARKSGMELVNSRELESATILGRIEPLRIVMAPAGRLAKNQIKYYQIAEEAVFRKHERRLTALKLDGKEKDRMLIELSEYAHQQIGSYQMAIDVLNKQLNQSLKLAKAYTQEIATVNLDFASDRYIRAYETFERGQLDSVLVILSIEQERRDIENWFQGKAALDSMERKNKDRKKDAEKARLALLESNLLIIFAAITQHDTNRIATQYQVLKDLEKGDLLSHLAYEYVLSHGNLDQAVIHSIDSAKTKPGDKNILTKHFTNLTESFEQLCNRTDGDRLENIFDVQLATVGIFQQLLWEHPTDSILIQGRGILQLCDRIVAMENTILSDSDKDRKYNQLKNYFQSVDLKELSILKKIASLRKLAYTDPSVANLIKLVDSLNAAMDVYPEAPTLTDSLQKYWGLMAMNQWQVQEWKMSLHSAKKAYSLNKNNPIGWRWLPTAYLLNGKLDKARKLYQMYADQYWPGYEGQLLQKIYLADLNQLSAEDAPIRNLDRIRKLLVK